MQKLDEEETLECDPIFFKPVHDSAVSEYGLLGSLDDACLNTEQFKHPVSHASEPGSRGCIECQIRIFLPTLVLVRVYDVSQIRKPQFGALPPENPVLSLLWAMRRELILS